MSSFSTLLTLCTLLLAGQSILSARPNAKKNAILIFADDAGFMQSAYNNSVCDTPNLDKLAARGLVINRGYTSVSSCSPSRSVLAMLPPSLSSSQPTPLPPPPPSSYYP
ncbi:N-sulphoglucosamine sulphohydrolase [Plakobranchus ocellatus]|uniref:N-sulphoglucosamine sulphohydrolase n=1 Tax=Plakobranchus ocellatus TaxID=259542 RepID=A0AAV4APF5_9GAST|nr:N-sulphoglucosamine sulphohydrolase [Plakobranchus ocellatus]